MKINFFSFFAFALTAANVPFSNFIPFDCEKAADDT
jgi:hypothetical protein